MLKISEELLELMGSKDYNLVTCNKFAEIIRNTDGIEIEPDLERLRDMDLDAQETEAELKGEEK